MCIGNSKDIRLPKSILGQCDLKDPFEIEDEDNVLTLRPVHITLGLVQGVLRDGSEQR